MWLSFSKQWLSWTYRQELSSVYPHTNIYSLPICIFCLRLNHHMKNISCVKVSYILHVFTNTLHSIWVLLLHIPLIYSSRFDLNRVNLVPVFWHYQSFSNNLFFCILCPTEKYVYRWPLYFCQVHLKLKKIVKYIWDIFFCDIPF